ncbi:MAG: hypothetical protein RML94_10190, partial [Bacteroidia bacterium]|nr:hypothetical protein [Bacteroidia bacterium]
MDKEKLFKEVLEKQEVNFLDDNVYHLPQYEQFLHNFLDIIAEELGREFVPKKNYNPLYKSTPILFPQEIFAPAMKQIADEQLRLEGYNVLAEKRPHMESYLSRLIDIIEEKIDPATRYHASLTDLTDEELKDLAKKRVYNALKL